MAEVVAEGQRQQSSAVVVALRSPVAVTTAVALWVVAVTVAAAAKVAEVTGPQTAA
ncbi:MAG TPA: hypothetical protein VFU74_09315 [Actinocrinis sp.]|nr:hypothetical protein [Actinocrinis sp.]